MVISSIGCAIPQDHENEDLDCPMLDRKPPFHLLTKNDVAEDGVMNMSPQS